MPIYLVNLNFFIIIAVVVYLTGRGASVLRPLNQIQGALLIPMRWGLGAGVWISVLFVLCATRLLYVEVIVGLGLLLLMAGGYSYRVDRRRFSFKIEPSKLKLPPTQGLPAGLIVLTLMILMGLTQFPAIAWDSNTYHLTVPRIYLEHHGFRPIAFNVYSNWPLNIELLYAGALAVGDYRLAKLMHFGLGAILVLTIYLFGQRLRDRTTGLWAAALFLINLTVLFELCVAYIDLGHALFLLLAVWSLWEAAQTSTHSQRRGLLLLAGLFAGWMGGTKLSALAYLPLLGIWGWWLLRRNTSALRAALEMLLYCLAPAGLLVLPWLIKCWLYTGNPVYPFLYGTFGGVDWSDDLTRRFDQWHHGIGMGRSWLDTLLLPIRVILSGRISSPQFDGSLNPIWLLVAPVVLMGMRHRRCVRALTILALLGFILWAKTSQQMRFLIPLIPLAGLSAGIVLADMCVRLSRWRQRVDWPRMVGRLLVLFLFIELSELYWQHQMPIDSQRTLTAAQPGQRAVFQYANAQLADDSLILFCNTNHGYGCHRDYLADSFYDASMIADQLRGRDTAASVRDWCGKRGITHVLWHKRDWKIDYPPALCEMLSDLRHCQLLFESAEQGDKLYLLQ